LKARKKPLIEGGFLTAGDASKAIPEHNLSIDSLISKVNTFFYE